MKFGKDFHPLEKRTKQNFQMSLLGHQSNQLHLPRQDHLHSLLAGCANSAEVLNTNKPTNKERILVNFAFIKRNFDLLKKKIYSEVSEWLI